MTIPARVCLLRPFLEQQRAGVLTADSVAEAIQVFWRDRPDVIIVDIGLPEEDGFALLRKIRAEEARRGQSSTPAVALTAYAPAGHREQTSAAGCAGHVIKPLIPDVLIATLTDLRPG
jgi:CheY-like chemotaxis protein